ncbi:MAG: patatin-like phospholipase family protein [Kiloniellaceae bacterium]
MPGTARVLALDGGGIRGIIPALVLERIEQSIGKPISDLFHMVAGTSTGGLLALGLTAPDGHGTGPRFGGADAVALYRDRGADIFSRSFRYRIGTLGGLTDAKYSAKGLEDVLEAQFGETWISEALVDVFVTAYDIEARTPRFLKSWKARGESLAAGETAADRDLLMRAAARATSAAPTYFDPARVESRAGRSNCLVDGGVFANNPAMCALASALKIYPGAQRHLVLSLGTGELERKISCDKAEDWGLVGWARPVLDIVFDGVSDTVDYQLRQNRALAYFRLQCDLGRFADGSRGPNDDMDDASPENIAKLVRKAQEMIAARQAEFDELVRRLAAPKDRRADLL